jgi:hypothetical protein
MYFFIKYKLIMNDTFIKQCIEIIHREDVKKELKEFIKPIINIIFYEIYPYIYLSLIFVIISFLLILGIFILLIRSNKYVSKND